MISSDEFCRLATDFNVIPLSKTLLADLHTPVSAYLSLRSEKALSFLFESAEPDEKIGRYSFIGIDPEKLLIGRGDRTEIVSNSESRHITQDILKTLRRETAHFRVYGKEGGFQGGFVGYLGYNCVRLIEQIPVPPGSQDEPPDAMFGLFTTVVQFDHRQHRVTVRVNVVVNDAVPLATQYDRARKKLDLTLLRLRNAPVPSSHFQCTIPPAPSDEAGYCAAVEKAKHHIHEGDMFQAVLSRKRSIPYDGDPFVVYRALRFVNPSPYLFYVDFGKTKLIGSSPEVLVRVTRGNVELLPIAGTRKRGITEAEDLELEKELLADAKETAEHVMLVDLGRNDVGRISAIGSVEVPVFKRVDRYSHVMHLVSHVRGSLRSDLTPLDALISCFPAGTVSGAPKVRAMEIINELEGERRGIYAGAVGYLGFDGTLDTCIAIRTIVGHNGTLTIQSGAGIVADSVPATEYRETVNKAQALLDAITLAAGGLHDPRD